MKKYKKKKIEKKKLIFQILNFIDFFVFEISTAVKLFFIWTNGQKIIFLKKKVYFDDVLLKINNSKIFGKKSIFVEICDIDMVIHHDD